MQRSRDGTISAQGTGLYSRRIPSTDTGEGSVWAGLVGDTILTMEGTIQSNAVLFIGKLTFGIAAEERWRTQAQPAHEHVVDRAWRNCFSNTALNFIIDCLSRQLRFLKRPFQKCQKLHSSIHKNHTKLTHFSYIIRAHCAIMGRS